MVTFLDSIHTLEAALSIIPRFLWLFLLVLASLRAAMKNIEADRREKTGYETGMKAYLATLATHDEKLELLQDIKDLGDFIGAMRESKLNVEELEADRAELVSRVVDFRERARLRKDQESEFVKQFDAMIEKLKEERGEKRREIKQKRIVKPGEIQAPDYESAEFKKRWRTV